MILHEIRRFSTKISLFTALFMPRLFLRAQKAKKSLIFYRNCRCKSSVDCFSINNEYNEILQSFNDTVALQQKHRQSTLQNMCKFRSTITVHFIYNLCVYLSNLIQLFYRFLSHSHSLYTKQNHNKQLNGKRYELF